RLSRGLRFGPGLRRRPGAALRRRGVRGVPRGARRRAVPPGRLLRARAQRAHHRVGAGRRRVAAERRCCDPSGARAARERPVNAPRSGRRVRAVPLLAVALLLAASPAAAQRTVVDREYDCTIIASTREFPYGVDQNGPPPMNAWGQVAFFASSRTEAGETI